MSELSLKQLRRIPTSLHRHILTSHVILHCISGESRIIFLPERSSIYQYRPEISAIIVKKHSRTRLLFARPLLYISKTQKMYCAFWK